MKPPKLAAFPRLAMQEKSKLTLTVQYADPRLTTQVPRAAIRRWVQAALFFDAEFIDDDDAFIGPPTRNPNAKKRGNTKSKRSID